MTDIGRVKLGIRAGMLGCMLLMLSGCVDHRLSFLNNFTPDSTAGIEVGQVVNNSGKTVESAVGLEMMLQQALRDQLGRADLLWNNTFSKKVVLDCKILDYEEGNAFKRVVPGWGATRLTIQCNMHQDSQVVGTIDATRAIFSYGVLALTTISGWQYVFANIGEDVAQELSQNGFARTDWYNRRSEISH